MSSLLSAITRVPTYYFVRVIGYQSQQSSNDDSFVALERRSRYMMLIKMYSKVTTCNVSKKKLMMLARLIMVTVRTEVYLHSIQLQNAIHSIFNDVIMHCC